MCEYRRQTREKEIAAVQSVCVFNAKAARIYRAKLHGYVTTAPNHLHAAGSSGKKKQNFSLESAVLLPDVRPPRANFSWSTGNVFWPIAFIRLRTTLFGITQAGDVPLITVNPALSNRRP